MSRCTHNDHPGMAPCQNEGVGEGGYCTEHGCCLCGGVMLADTEDWKVHLCHECFMEMGGHLEGALAEELIDAAYEAGRKSVIGGVLEPDEVVEKPHER